MNRAAPRGVRLGVLARLIPAALLATIATAQKFEPWLVRVQCDDGHWSAAHFADRGAGQIESPGAGRPARDLRVTSLAALAIAADGSTIRSGPYRQSLKQAARWLRAQQDDEGRIALSSEPDWLHDHALATWAFAELGRVSTYTILAKNVDRAVTALARHLQRHDTVDPELLLLSQLAVRAARDFDRKIAPPATAIGPSRYRVRTEALDAQIERLTKTTVAAASKRHRAAQLLLAVLAAERDERRIAELAKPLDDLAWIDAFEQPLAAMYYTFACYRLGGDRWKTLGKTLKASVVQRQRREGELGSSWDPRGAFGVDAGRVGATAVATLILTAYYRYVALEVGS